MGEQGVNIRFVVPGEPVGKARPRIVTRRGKAPRAITSDKSRRYEESVRAEAYRGMDERGRIVGPIAVNIDAYLYPASDWPAWRRRMVSKRDMEPGQPSVWHTYTPDLDNVVKSILDGCNGVVFKDDGQVCRISASKQYSLNPRVEVVIAAIGGVYEKTKLKEVKR